MSERTLQSAPSVVDWTALDLDRVKDTAERLQSAAPDLDLAEDFCRALRQSRSDWEYFEQRMPGQFHAAGRWLAARSREALAVLESPAWRELRTQTSDVRRSGIERHLHILHKALHSGQRSKKRIAA